MKDLLVDIDPERYEIFALEATSPWSVYLKQRILEEIPNVTSNKKTLLDVGMGTGHMLFDLLNSQEINDFQFHGIDVDPRMVAFCREKKSANNKDAKINVREGNVSALPYADRSFSLIYARSVIHHWAEPEKGLQELCRVLDNGGIVIIHEPLADAEKVALQTFNDARRKCGIGEMTTDEKYTLPQINQLMEACRMEEINYLVLPGSGIAALGCEILIRRAS
ncbi:class I SAM-dependent methyltransferase [Pantoea dispersa]|uniref:class I SAM-dependent methyltransferase n=1 Tax=Pantoea dispersa TaxID=59814 RepID=UPI001BAE5234|nr:class I SAM-dependent methyltransferase [Pantoea dispersa]MBS0899810.1 class I SAM-dependent methyltransferase [Pantoea dispersa]MBS0907642.1 class I SAM-dependent methyltransferase [Pantoea dispersa]